MKNGIALILAALLALPLTSLGHPGSGIVIDGQGRIYFTDTGQGVWKIDAEGRVTAHEGSAFHWMAIDHQSHPPRDNSLARLPAFVEPSTTIERVGINPTLLLSSDFPLTTSPDGALYYPEFAPGGLLRIYKLPQFGERSVLATIRTGADGKELQWLNGMAAGFDGSIYFTENAAVRKVTPQGDLSTIARDVTVADCRRIEGANERLGPMLRGLDVARDGTIYVAASACRALLKITPDGVVTTALRNEPPWHPTGVVVNGDVIYVLEYLHTNGGDRREWTPRVRRISPGGSSTIIAEIERSGAKDSRPVQVRPTRP
jgi:hypothetical protein